MTLSPEFEARVLYMQKIISPDDIYIFAESLLHTSTMLANTLERFSNLHTCLENEPTLLTALENLIAYQKKWKNGDTEQLKIECFNLRNFDD